MTLRSPGDSKALAHVFVLLQGRHGRPLRKEDLAPWREPFGLDFEPLRPCLSVVLPHPVSMQPFSDISDVPNGGVTTCCPQVLVPDSESESPFGSLHIINCGLGICLAHLFTCTCCFVNLSGLELH